MPKVGNSLPFQFQRWEQDSSRVFNELPVPYGLAGLEPSAALCFGVDGCNIVGLIPDGRGKTVGGPGAFVSAAFGALVGVGSFTCAAGAGFTRCCAAGESGEFGVSAFAGLRSFL